MAYTRRVLMKYGELGAAIRTPLIQDNGNPLDIDLNTGWSVRCVVTAKDGSTLLIDTAMVEDPDQTQYPNYFAHFMTAGNFTALLSSISGGLTTLAAAKNGIEFDIEFIVTDPSGNKPKFPKDENGWFGTLVLGPSKV